ncbi:MAG: enoyl-CoA hydratase-related protein [Acidimicrobiales bacterium]|nr:enoyl-CoA hydratase-related protein [Acidimicrobiales bacterium]
MHLERLRLQRRGFVAWVELSGEPLDAREAAELVAVATELAEDEAIRVVVLGSQGAHFCPGAGSSLDPLAFLPDPAAAIASLRPPVVAVCRGEVASVGLELALAADVRLADTTALFSVSDVTEGRVPSWGGTQRLPRAVGPARALAMLMLGERVDGTTAAQIGLVHDVVDAEGFDEALTALVEGLAALAPLALALAKEAVSRGTEIPMADGLRLEGDLNHLLQTTEDRAEGLQAFFEKREPRFSGR